MKPVPVDPVRLGQRLQSARKRSNLKQQGVADRLGLARTTIVAIEKGERVVRPGELVSLARLYGVSLSELQRPTEPLSDVVFQFRGNLEQEGQLELEAICRSFAEDYLYLEGLCKTPLPRQFPIEVPLGTSPERSARIAAEDERRRLGLGLEPIRDLKRLLEERIGIRVFQFNMEAASSVAAVYFYQEPAGAVVCVNSAHGWRRRRLSLAHEYGHVIGSRHTADVLRDDSTAARHRQLPSEVFADSFQRHFLIPTGALERFVTTRRAERAGRFVPNDIVELANHYGVSFEAMCRALEEESLVKSGAFDYLQSQGFTPEYGQAAEQQFLVDAARDQVSKRYQRLAVTAFGEGELSEGTLARLLRVDRVLARSTVRELASATAPDMGGGP